MFGHLGTHLSEGKGGEELSDGWAHRSQATGFRVAAVIFNKLFKVSHGVQRSRLHDVENERVVQHVFDCVNKLVGPVTRKHVISPSERRHRYISSTPNHFFEPMPAQKIRRGTQNI